MMRNLVKGLLALVQRDDAGTDELAPSLPAAEAELASAHAAMAAAERAFEASLLHPDEVKSQQLDAAHGEARVRVKRAEALIAALRERLAAARGREAEAVKLQKYEAAKRQAAEVRDVLETMYPQAAETIVAIMRALAEAEITVAAANEELPAGAEPLPGIEAALRNIPGSLPELISEVEVHRWCYPGDGRADAIAQKHVERSEEDGRGLLRHARGGVEYLVRRRFMERRYSGFVPRIAPDRFAVSISLPGVRAGDRPFFAPLDRQGIADPQAVLKSLDQPYRTAPASATASERVEWKALDPIDAEAERRACATVTDRVIGRV